jgi:hypothetical protein
MTKCSFVIRGKTAHYVSGFTDDDYGVVLPNSLIVVGNNIHGLVQDCHGGQSVFCLPIPVFQSLETLFAVDGCVPQP